MNLHRLSSITLWFLGVFIVAAIAQAVAFPFTLIGGDEGRFAQDALRLLMGEWPIADFTTRAPILLALIAGSIKLFGASILTLRLPLLIIHALSSGFMYLVGREFFSERVGRISGVLYGIIPYTLWNGSLIKSESLTILFMLVAAYAVGRSFIDNRNKWFLFAGVMIGLALVERSSAVIMLGVFGSLIIFENYRNLTSMSVLRRVFIDGSVLGFGVVLGFLSVVSVLFLHNADPVMEFFFSPFLLDAVISTKEVTFSYLGIFRTWGLVVVEVIAVQAGVIFVLLLCFGVGITRRAFPRAPRSAALIPSALVFIAFLVHTGTILYHGTYHIEIFLIVLVSTGILVAVIMRSRADEQLSIYGMDRGVFLICMWVILHIFVYSLFLPGHSREIIPPLVFAAALAGDMLWSSRRITKNQSVVIILACVELWVGGALWFQNPRSGGWWWSQETMNSVAVYIAQNTTTDQRIFTANPLPVVLAGRRTVLDMNPYAVLLANGADGNWGSFASPNDYYQELVANPPKYAIVDGRMKGQYFSTYPMFEDFLRTRYQIAQTFWTGERRGKVEIWELK